MFCCVRRNRGRKEGNIDERPVAADAKSRGAWPLPGNYVREVRGGKSKGTADRSLKDGNIVVLAGPGAAVGAATVVVAAASDDQKTDRNSDGSSSQGCCCGGGGGGGGCGGGGCGGCGGCGG